MDLIAFDSIISFDRSTHSFSQLALKGLWSACTGKYLPNPPGERSKALCLDAQAEDEELRDRFSMILSDENGKMQPIMQVCVFRDKFQALKDLFISQNAALK